ncbi:MAG: DUF4097 family beta strand repeat-containing protein, partial [Lachnospiraceae bacterium]|nr:DUF4097 family beta strand repeat-containing protein [Lachnospiraceae bacterium]
IGLEPFYTIEDDTALFTENGTVVEDQAISAGYSGESFQSVELKTSQVNLTVGMSSENTLYVESEKVQRYQAYVEDQVLYIIIEGTLSASSAVEGDGIMPSVQLLLPSGFAQNGGAFGLEVLASNVTVEALQTDSMELKVSAGVVKLDSMVSRELAVTMSAGSVTGQNMNITESSDLEMSAGSMSLAGNLSGTITAQVTAGDMTLKLEQPFEAYDCQIVCAAGKVTVAGESYSGLTAAETISHGGANLLDINCSVGVINVEFE